MNTTFYGSAQMTTADTIIDGPYLHDEKGQTIMRTIKGGKAQAIPWQDQPLTVHVKNHPDWTFSVSLKKVLAPEPYEWPAPEKLLVLSDIEGEFSVFRTLLIAGRVIDEQYRWTFGKGHLVIDGDLFDRGTNVTATLWLIYQLEQEARKAGGYVHCLLGNHDIMNLSGDWRYVDSSYFINAKMMGLRYGDLYSRQSELGRWLRTKNVMEKIGDRLFVHGGLSPAVNEMQLSIAEINAQCRSGYDTPRKQLPAAKQNLFNQNAPFWYRGYFMEPRATMATVDSTLSLYRCRQIIVGHTIVKGRNPALYYQGKVLAVDVDAHTGQTAAVLIEGDTCYAVNGQGEKRLLDFIPGNDIIREDEIL